MGRDAVRQRRDGSAHLLERLHVEARRDRCNRAITQSFNRAIKRLQVEARRDRCNRAIGQSGNQAIGQSSHQITGRDRCNQAIKPLVVIAAIKPSR
eukprot:2798138-Prymnesium_polylepis.1